MKENKKYTFKGKVIRSVFTSSEFSVYALDVDKDEYPDIKHNKYGNVSISGELADLSYNAEYDITAEETETKYGVGYKVINISREAPSSTEDVYNFLREILTENQANVIIKNYPDIIDRVKENRVDDINFDKLKGIGEKTFEKIKNKIITNYYLMDLVTEFKNILSLSMIKKIYNKYSSIELLREKLRLEPYTTLTRVSGIGFKKADAITLELQKQNVINFGYDVKTSPDRCLACLLYLLDENENEGHTKMSLPELRKQCLQLVPQCSNHFDEVVNNKIIYYNKDTMDIALRKTYEIEYEIAQTILHNLNSSVNVWDYDIEKYRKVNGFDLSDEQLQAVSNICKYKISILNGAAGTGKSASTQAIINMLREHHKSFKLFSPTGKAAKILSEYTGCEAKTIHRGLGYNPAGEPEWTFNKEHKLYADVVIVDEFSMVDVKLFKRLIDAVDFRYTRLLMIGDNAQLCSVGCGNLLHDFMETKLVPTVTLTKVFRYGEGGLMRIATDTRFCKPYLNNDMKHKMTMFGDNKDYTFVDLPSDIIPQNVVALYKKLLNKGYGIEDIQVLTAKNVGECGTVTLNNMIQKIANPNYGSEVCMKVGETTYYEGDLVIQTQNNYNAEMDLNHLDEETRRFYGNQEEAPTVFVANGESGIIKEIYTSYIIIDFDGIYVKYHRADMNMVKLGYSISIHRSQGSGFNIVILCTPQSHAFMMNSNLIYVGLTRMKEICYHLGTLSSVNKAVIKKANLTRNTFMQYLLTTMKKEEYKNISNNVPSNDYKKQIVEEDDFDTDEELPFL